MAIVLALVSALAYGVSDFVGGLVSRRTSPWAVAVVAALTATAGTTLLATLLPGEPTSADLGWAALAGLGSGAGTGFLYRGLSSGRMGVVAPVSAVGAAVVPVLVGAASGERPSALVWAGVVLALPAIWLVAAEPKDDLTRLDEAALPAGGHGLVDGALAGLSFGVLFAALGQVPDRAGLWPLVVTQLVSLPVLVALATLLGAAWLPRGRPVWWASAAGILGALAAVAFLLATQRGYLTVAGVLASLYPAVTVLLAAVLLRERVHRAQGIGLALCAVAVALVAAG